MAENQYMKLAIYQMYLNPVEGSDSVSLVKGSCSLPQVLKSYHSEQFKKNILGSCHSVQSQ